MSDTKLDVALEPLTVYLCDDLRTENNGKLIVIGIYTEHIRLEKPPVELTEAGGIPTMFGTLVVTCAMKESGNVDAFVRITFPGDGRSDIQHLKQSREAPLPYRKLNFILSSVPIPLDIEGTMAVDFRNGEKGKWKRIYEIQIIHGSPATSH